jgi:hypothetical protein
MAHRLLPALLIVLNAYFSTAQSQQTLTLCDFEEPSLPAIWEFNSGQPRLIRDGALVGQQSLEITFDPRAPYNGAYMNSYRLPRDWSAHDALVLDVLNPNAEPIAASVLIADQAWQDSGRTYWNRHNASRTLPPGRTEWVIPVDGLYRGEAGSRNNDIKRNIDPDSIVRVDFGFGRRGQTGRVVLDHLRLVKTAIPSGVWAFDFGPPSQSLMLGWTPVSNETAYTADRGYGWGPRGGTPWSGAARDTTFGTTLLQDFCEAGGYNFHINTPPGQYSVTVFFENSGYWGGEQAKHTERRILVGGTDVWRETRPDGPAHALYRFENVEPVGVDIWDTYMAAELARPATFEVTVKGDGLTLRFEADRVWGSKVAGLAIHGADDQDAAVWLEGQLEKVAEEFRSKAVCLDPPSPTFEVPAAWRPHRLVAWPVRIEDDVTPNSVPESPPAAPEDLRLARLAVRAEFEPFCVAIRPLEDLGTCRLALEPFRGPGTIRAEIRIVRYLASRGFGNIAYRIRPHTLRPETDLDMPKGVTREVIVTVLVRRDAPAGNYEGALRLVNANGQTLLRTALDLTVRPVTLDRQTDFLMGYFGLMPPDLIPNEKRWDVLDQTLQMLRAHGMNAISGGPSWRLKGWQDGKPLIDFGDMDRFFALLKKHGFNGPLNGYGGGRFAGLHERYEKGQVGAAVEQQSGLPYEEALMRAWEAVDQHARQSGWPTIFYAMCDETRVRDQAERELEFMKLMAKVSAAYPQTVRTSGSYSVNFKSRPTDLGDMLHWHQRFFEALDISSLNHHDASVMAEADKLGKEIQTYNQGRTRYSFGLYQWSEYRKGVRARWQWHLNILHGYQFFDLDGREPDTAMICYGRQGLYPTIHFERCREGAEDFYLYQTLWNLIEHRQRSRHRNNTLDSARSLLDEAVSRVELNQRQPPEDFDADTFKADIVRAMQELADRPSGKPNQQ